MGWNELELVVSTFFTECITTYKQTSPHLWRLDRRRGWLLVGNIDNIAQHKGYAWRMLRGEKGFLDSVDDGEEMKI